MLQQTMLQRTVFINKIRMLQRTHRCSNERGGILSSDLARVCAWRVGLSRFD